MEKTEKKEKNIFSASEIDKLFLNGSDTAKIILTLIYSGMRINELFMMKRSDVHLTERYMVGGEKTAAGRERVIPINKKIYPFINEWYNNNNFYLIIDSAGNPINVSNFRKKYYSLLDSLGIEKKSPHSARHTFAILMDAANVRLENLQKILGLASFSTAAEIYIHSDINQLREEVDLI